MKKTVMIPIAAIVLGAALLLSNGKVSAETMLNPSEGLVQKIAQKFGLNQSEVQAVFDQHRDEMHTAMQQRLEDQLTQEVADGKLTEAQKQAILAKRAELETNKPDPSTFEDQTREERQAQREQQRQELEAWATQNGIDMSYLMPGIGHHKGHGPMMDR